MENFLENSMFLSKFLIFVNFSKKVDVSYPCLKNHWVSPPSTNILWPNSNQGGALLTPLILCYHPL
jgi:hypothetical protein